ncbi:alpha-glucan family phosphorylase [bacterium]|nr:alpha-glucan family phosphorylase [candidate division CSSED10-310 bacterium]
MKVNPFLVDTNIPKHLESLRELAMNLWFSWNDDALDLFIRLGYNPSQRSRSDYWETSHQNPVKLLSIIPQEDLMEAGKDDSFISNLNRIYRKFKDYMSKPKWFSENHRNEKDFLIAYFSCEYGLDESLPVYSGGLGILSGDHLKSASDLGIPLVGIGLLYQEGYFQQYLNNDGWQQERYPDNDWYNMSVKLETTEDGSPLKISLPLGDEEIYCQIWCVKVGSIPLYLLDTNIPENSIRHRAITSRLYGGDREMRIQQEIILGMGGVKALEALKLSPSVYHINEGHSAFLSIQRMMNLMEKYDISLDAAKEIIRATSVFTTHTPVPAGNEHFSLELVSKYFKNIIRVMGISLDEFLALGQQEPGKSNSFCLTVLALRMSAFCNGVSKLHGETTRNMWHFLWPELPIDEVPITHITNGIHTFSWISKRMKELLTRYLGPKFEEEPEDPALWTRIDNIPDNEIWRVRQLRRESLIAFTRNRLSQQIKQRGVSIAEIRHAQEVLNTHALTIGFARRFASYKRATLLFHDIERLTSMLGSEEYPVQIIFAGKAHPQDTSGKELIRQIVTTANKSQFRDKIVFLENYDISVARHLVQGVDIWLNTPRRPLEASGTSGMKAIINGVLNVSILDGWWCEAYGDLHGWAIGSGEEYEDQEIQDDIESEALYRLLEHDIIPMFYDRDRTGLPREWIKMIKTSMKNLGSYFSTHRMLIDYTQQLYLKASHTGKTLLKNKAKTATELAQWRDRVYREWSHVSVSGSAINAPEKIKVGDKISISVNAWLGFLTPEDVSVEVYFGKLDAKDDIIDGEIVALKPEEQIEGGWKYSGEIVLRFNGRCGYAVRILPKHKDMVHPYTPYLIKWEK